MKPFWDRWSQGDTRDGGEGPVELPVGRKDSNVGKGNQKGVGHRGNHKGRTEEGKNGYGSKARKTQRKMGTNPRRK